MRYFLAVVCALAILLALPAMASAADFDLYAGYGFVKNLDIGEGLEVHAVTPYVLGGRANFGRFIVGADYMSGGVDITLEERTMPSWYMQTRDYFIYGGYDFGFDRLDLYAFAGYANSHTNCIEYFGDLGDFEFSETLDFSGLGAGVGARVPLGPFVIEGRFMATLFDWYSYGSPLKGNVGDEIDPRLWLADMRFTWPITDHFGVYAGLQYAHLDMYFTGDGIYNGIDIIVDDRQPPPTEGGPLGANFIWLNAGLSVSF